MATDQELLSALRTGKPQGLEAAIGQYSAYVAAVIDYQLGDLGTKADVEELSADVFYTLWQWRNRLKTDHLRGWLGTHGFAIEREELCREGDTLYTAFLVRAGAMPPLSPGELWAGRNAPDPLRGPWLDLWLARVGRALAGMSQARGEETASRREELERVRADLLEMKKEWETWQR